MKKLSRLGKMEVGKMFRVAKWVFRILLCVAVLYLVVGSTWSCLSRAGGLPSVNDAPWVIQTYSNDELRIPSRTYYASEVEVLPDGTPIAQNPYWSHDGEKYHKIKADKPFPKSDYGDVSINRRKE